jgi:type IV pilus assembly protein PilY1
VSSGYNPSGDGKGRVFMLNARTGAVIREFVTSATADIGQVSTFVSTSAAGQLADAAYAGDLAGNLWHFDLATGATRLIATLTDGSGAAQPITTAPELTMVENQRVVLVGTGKLLGISDFSPTQIQSFYAITDTGTTVANIRTDLDARSLSIVGGTRTLTGTAPNWRTRRGWYVDLPAGELAHTDPVIAQGSVFFSTNQPSGSACESKSYLYMIDIVTGAQRSAEVFGAAGAVAWAGSLIGNVMASRVTVARLPSMSLVALVHQSDNTVATRTVMPGRSQNIRRAAWKEVQR